MLPKVIERTQVEVNTFSRDPIAKANILSNPAFVDLLYMYVSKNTVDNIAQNASVLLRYNDHVRYPRGILEFSYESC